MARHVMPLPQSPLGVDELHGDSKLHSNVEMHTAICMQLLEYHETPYKGSFAMPWPAANARSYGRVVEGVSHSAAHLDARHRTNISKIAPHHLGVLQNTRDGDEVNALARIDLLLSGSQRLVHKCNDLAIAGGALFLHSSRSDGRPLRRSGPGLDVLRA